MRTAVEIPTGSNRMLKGRVYAPRSPVGAIIVHGATAVRQRFYAPLAEYLAGLGFTVLTYDYRGVGESVVGRLQDDPTTMADWIDDAEAAHRWFRQRVGAVPFIAVGHSFGGQVAAALNSAGPADGIILVGAQNGYYGAFPFVARQRMRLTWFVAVPLLTTALGYVPSWAGLGTDLPAGIVRQWGRWCRSPDYLLSEFPEFASRLATYRGPVLALSFTDDGFAPLANIRWLNAKLAGATLEHRHLDPSDVGLSEIGHFGLFRKASSTTLWPLVSAFAEEAARAVTSGTGRSSPLLREIMHDLDYGR